MGQVKIGKLKRWERRKRVGHGRGWNERLKLGGKKALGKGRQRSNRRWATKFICVVFVLGRWSLALIKSSKGHMMQKIRNTWATGRLSLKQILANLLPERRLRSCCHTRARVAVGGYLVSYSHSVFKVGEALRCFHPVSFA